MKMQTFDFIADCDETVLRDKFQSLLQYTTDMIYFKDRNSVFTLCSDSLIERFTGSKHGLVIGKSDFDFFDAACAAKSFEEEQEIIRTGKPLIGQVAEEICGGTKTWVFSTKIPLRDANGNITGTFGISRDITEQKQNEANLVQAHTHFVEASRRAGQAEIATNVIHNIGNVLTSIKVALAQSESLSSEFASDKLDRVADLIETHSKNPSFFNSGQRGQHLPEYLRTVATAFSDDKSRLEKELSDCKRHLEHVSNIVAQQQAHATAPRSIERINISELVSDAIHMSSSSLARHNIRVQQNYDKDLFVETDQHQVLQIVVNLIRNAKHACEDSPNDPRCISIAVAVDEVNQQFVVNVADNGIGISQETINKLFNYGFTTREQGNGFGLHSAMSIARELGGSLLARSEGIGKGATFTLTLPGKV